MIIKAYAKINLSLDVIGKREDGFHNLDMLIQSISLCDIIDIEKIDENIVIMTNNANLPNDLKNDAFKATELMRKAYDIDHGYRINIDKRIPISAGLGGGSSDAAAVMNAILDLEGFEKNYDVLDEIALKIGTEVIYCLRGGMARVTGKGDIIEPLNLLDSLNVLIVNPGYEVSTPSVYKSLTPGDYSTDGNTLALIKGLKKKDMESAYMSMQNSLQKSVISMHSDILYNIETMYSNGAKKAMMSGSGPTVFGIFEDINFMKKAKDALSIKNNKVFEAQIIKGEIL